VEENNKGERGIGKGEKDKGENKGKQEKKNKAAILLPYGVWGVI
jgi:hypothetical protein